MPNDKENKIVNIIRTEDPITFNEDINSENFEKLKIPHYYPPEILINLPEEYNELDREQETDTIRMVLGEPDHGDCIVFEDDEEAQQQRSITLKEWTDSIQLPIETIKRSNNQEFNMVRNTRLRISNSQDDLNAFLFQLNINRFKNFISKQESINKASLLNEENNGHLDLVKWNKPEHNQFGDIFGFKDIREQIKVYNNILDTKSFIFLKF